VDFGGLLVLGLVWLLFNLIGQGRGNPRTAQRKGAGPRQPRAGGTADPTQQEGSRLEQLLRELERNLEGVGGAPPPRPQRSSTPRLPVPAEEEDVEDRDSLEEPEQVISLETPAPRRERVVYDQDTAAEEIARRRIESARTQDRALSKSDHKVFDAKIRQEPADHTAVRRYTPAQLRDAVVWREILGPPVSERP
jgi:hypothetical protein